MEDSDYWQEFARRTHIDPENGRKFQYDENRVKVYIEEPIPEPDSEIERIFTGNDGVLPSDKPKKGWGF